MIRILDKTGDYNSEVSDKLFEEVVQQAIQNQGYFTMSRRSERCFVPFHQIECIREEKV